MTQVKVRNLQSQKTYREIPNQFEITTDDCCIFQSYRSTIAKENFKTGELVFDPNYWDYSRTTMKYLNQWLGNNARDLVKAGKVKFENLN